MTDALMFGRSAMEAARHTALARHRRRKLSALMGCASAGAIMLAGLASPASVHAQAFKGSATIEGGSANGVINTSPDRTDIALFNDEVVINWVPDDTAGTGTIDFLPEGALAIFDGSDVGVANFTVLNRILPVDANGAPVSRSIALNGAVQSTIGNTTAGNIWFYTPGGIIAGATSSFDVGSLVLTTDSIDTTNGLYGPDGEIRFRGTAGSTAAVEVRNGAQINALNEGSYVALVAPRVVQGGMVNVNGSAAYVGAEQADLTINGGLFDIQIGVGTTDANGVVHTGTTTGPASTAGADSQRVFMVAVPKNDALTMLLSGTIGYTPAASATQEGSAVILSAGGNINGGNAESDDTATIGAGISITDAVFKSFTRGYATGDIAIRSDGTPIVAFNDDADFTARDSIAVDVVNNGLVSVSGDLSLAAGRRTAGGTIRLTADGAANGQVPASRLIVGGDLRLDVSALGNLPFFSFGTDPDATGGSIDIAATDGGQIGAASLDARANAVGGFEGMNQGNSRLGNATGGDVSVGASGGGAISFDATTIDVSASMDDDYNFFAATTGGDATGGTIDLSADGGTLALDTGMDGLTLDARADGGSGTDTGGDATGGTIRIAIADAAIGWGRLDARASAQAGPGDFGGTFGSAQGSADGIQLDIGSGGSLDIGGSVRLEAEGLACCGDGGGNAIAGGVIGIRVHDGGSFSASGQNRYSVRAFGNKDNEYEDSGGPMTVTGGEFSIDVDGGTMAISNFYFDASAFAGGSATARGSATGGNVTIRARGGGTLTFTDSPSYASASVSAGARGGFGPLGADATGGSVLVYASDGTIEGGQRLSLSASASAGGSNGNAGGSAQGGSVTVETRAGTAGTALIDLDALSLYANAGGFGEGATTSYGYGGDGDGGTATLNLFGGRFNASTLTVSASGFGGGVYPGYTGGVGTGGEATLLLEGADAAIDDIAVRAEGLGGFAFGGTDSGMMVGTPGEGHGGTAAVMAASGTLTALSDTMTGAALLISADGRGGAPFGSLDVSASDGGDGFGGTARLTMDADSTASLTLADLTVQAEGLGAPGGTYDSSGMTSPGMDAGDGGTGTGGMAELSLAGGSLGADSVSISSGGVGGDGGAADDDIADAGDGGDGIGGTTTVSLTSPANLDIAKFKALSEGIGGTGGLAGAATVIDENGDPIAISGTGNGGDGGAGTGGTVAMTTGLDIGFDTLTVSAGGSGGNGGLAGLGGAGGLATGGSAMIAVTAGALTVGDRLGVTASGVGGDGAESGSGAGGDGGDATGGDASFSADGGSTAVDTASLTIAATAAGGKAGVSAAGGMDLDGAAGGGATGGTAGLSLSGGAQLDFGQRGFVIAFASGADGGDASQDGVGGAGGDAAGGTATVSVDGATLRGGSGDGNGNGDGESFFSFAADAGAGGGDGGDGATGGAGGDARGGTAELRASDATLTLRNVIGSAAGAGGDGGRGESAANDGSAGSGTGGSAVFAVANATAATQRLASLVLLTDGQDGVGAGATGMDGMSGHAEIRNVAQGPAGGLIIDGPLFLSAKGKRTDSDSGVVLVSRGAPLTVGGNARFDSDAGAAMTFGGAGTLDVAGSLRVSAMGDVAFSHANQTGTPSDSIHADSILIGSNGDISGGAMSLLNADGDILLNALGGASFGTLTAGDSVAITATGAISGGNATATAGPIVIATDPGASGASVSTGDLDSGGYVDVAAGGALETGDVAAASDAVLSAYGGSLTAGDVTAGDDVWLSAYGDDPAGSVTAGTIRTTGEGDDDAATSTGQFDDDINGGAGPAGAVIRVFGAGSVTTGGVDNATGRTILVADTGAIDSGVLSAPGGIALLAGGDVTAGGATSDGLVYVGDSSLEQGLREDYDVSALAGLPSAPIAGTLSFDGAVAAGRLIAAAEGDVAFTSVDSGSAVDIDAGGAISGDGVRADDAVTLTGAQGVTLADLDSGGATRLMAPDGAVSVTHDLVSAGRITAAGQSVKITALGGLDIASASASDGDIGITTGGDLAIDSGTASGGIALATTSGDVTGRMLMAGGDISLVSTNGNVNGDTLDATGDIALASGSGAVTGTGLSSDGDIMLSSTSGNVASDALTADGIAIATGGDATLGMATAARTLSVDAGGVARFTAAATAPDISLSSADIDIADGATLGAAGLTDSISLAVIDPASPTIIGGDGDRNGGAEGYVLSAAEISRLFSGSFAVAAPATSTVTTTSLGASGPPDVIVLAFTLNAGPQGNMASDGRFAITTPGRMRIEGAVQLKGLVDQGGLDLSADDAIELIAGQGSIDLRDSDGELGGTLDLTTADFIAATQDAIADVATVTSIEERDARLAQNDGLALDDGMIRSGNIRLSVSGGAYIQNSGAGDDYDQRRGFTANSIAISTEGPDTQLVLNGRVRSDQAMNGFAQGDDTIPLVSINGVMAGSGGAFDPGSTINGCVVASATACAAGTPQPPVQPPIEPDDTGVDNELNPTQDEFEGRLDPSQEDSGTRLNPTSDVLNAAGTILVTFQPVETIGYPSLVDEPVTGVGNDDLWLPDCADDSEAGCAVGGEEP